MKQIIVVKPKTLTKEVIKNLSLHGLIVIEHKNPSEVRIITPLEGIEGEVVFQSALAAIVDQQNTLGNKAAESFGRKLTKKLLKADEN